MAKISYFRQFLILLYKGALLRKRHYIVTFFEIVIPVFIASIFPMIMSEQNASMAHYGSSFDAFDRNTKSGECVNGSTFKPYSPYGYSNSHDIYIVYAPNDNVTRDFMENVVKKFNESIDRSYSYRTVEMVIQGVNTEEELQKYCLNILLGKDDMNADILGTVFNNFHSSQKELPGSLDYKIKYADYHTNNQFKTSTKYRALDEDSPHYDPAYSRTYFLGWQASVEETFIETKMNESGKLFDYKVNMQRIPFPAHKKLGSQFSIIAFTPMIISYGYYIFMLNLLRRVIEEKFNGSKELMKMMGMTDTVYWISTFLNYFIVGIVTVLCITIIYKSPLRLRYIFLPNMDFFLLFIILLLYIVSVILFCMAFTIFFNRAVFAIVAFIIIWDASFNLIFQNFFSPNPETQTSYFDLTLGGKLGICLIPTGSMLTVFKMISVQMNWGDGFSWSNISEYAISTDINMSMVLGMMVLSCCLYSFIIWYFDKVWPWQPGVPQPFYFMFTKSYWCGSKPNFDDVEIMKNKNREEEYFEEEPRGIYRGVEIRNLSKVNLIKINNF